MNKDKFYIINLVRNLILDFDKYLTNFPHIYIELKKEIMNTSYEMLRITLEANETYSMNKRIDYQDKIIANIKYLDFLINSCYDKKIINSKKYLKFGSNLDYILKYIYAWRNKSMGKVG